VFCFCVFSNKLHLFKTSCPSDLICFLCFSVCPSVYLTFSLSPSLPLSPSVLVFQSRSLAILPSLFLGLSVRDLSVYLFSPCQSLQTSIFVFVCLSTTLILLILVSLVILAVCLSLCFTVSVSLCQSANLSGFLSQYLSGSISPYYLLITLYSLCVSIFFLLCLSLSHRSAILLNVVLLSTFGLNVDKP
jgi:hypothetical protein